MSATTTNIPHEPIEIDIDSIELSAGRLVCLIKPTWVSKKLIFKKLGIDDNNIYYSIFPVNDEDEQHGVVIKIYPANSDVYTGEKKELQLIDQLIPHELTPYVLLTFFNGFIFNPVPGKTLDNKNEHTQ